MMSTRSKTTAALYRMVTPQHVCPFGLKARWLLKRRRYHVEEHWLTSRTEQDAFKAEQGVNTTPQIFIGGVRIGGYEDLRRFVGLTVRDAQARSYRPIVAVFCVAGVIALTICWLTDRQFLSWELVGRFIAVSMCLLAMLKLRDVDRFANTFLGYDLWARAYVPYAYLYPFAELASGALMLAGIASWLSVPVALVIGATGAASVFKAVYIDKRELTCACVGGDSNVPLGLVSLTESLMMAGMAITIAVVTLAP